MLTETDNPRRLWSDLIRKLAAEGGQVYEKIVQLKMLADDGKMRSTDTYDSDGVLLILQKISSSKKDSFKSWLESIESNNALPSIVNKGEIILYQPDNSVKIEVMLEDDTVWLTQEQIALLFDRERIVITKHINNIFSEGELDEGGG